jgi:hypothetical protein
MRKAHQVGEAVVWEMTSGKWTVTRRKLEYIVSSQDEALQLAQLLGAEEWGKLSEWLASHHHENWTGESRRLRAVRTTWAGARYITLIMNNPNRKKGES